MVLKFKEYINELWSKGVERNVSGELRKEDGTRVKTSLGVDIILHNTKYDYEELIKFMLNEPGEEPLGIDFDNIGNYPMIGQREILRGESTNKFLVNKNYVAAFEVYGDIEEYDYWDIDGLSEEDYISICKGIVEALNKCDVGRKKGNSSYDYTCVLVLMDESDVFNYECELDEYAIETYWDDFKELFEDRFKDVELITYSYNNYAATIAIEINYDNLIHYQEYREFVENYFKGLKDMYETDED